MARHAPPRISIVPVYRAQNLSAGLESDGIKELNSIDELLKVDESCAKESDVVFGGLGPNAMECANVGLRVFSAAANWLRKYEEKKALNESFNKTAEELGITGEQLYAIVSRSTDPQPGGPVRVSADRAAIPTTNQPPTT